MSLASCSHQLCQLVDKLFANLRQQSALRAWEVCREPVGAIEPVFPLQERYYQCNYTIEGLEKKAEPEIGTEDVDYSSAQPPIDQQIIDGKSAEHSTAVDYKFTIDGKRI